MFTEKPDTNNEAQNSFQKQNVYHQEINNIRKENELASNDNETSYQKSNTTTCIVTQSGFSKLGKSDWEDTDLYETEILNETLSENENINYDNLEESKNLLCLSSEESEYDTESQNTGYTSRWKANQENQYTLNDVHGLDEAKETLISILIYPSLYPHFFPQKIRWNQILLYGPPGTGKTMLAKAVAPEIKGTFHKISGADLLSHWQGQTEKQIRSLFSEMGSNSTPKVLFFDEIDGLFRKRTNSEDDSTRRIKTELLTHLDDFTDNFKSHNTFLIGATNCPWDIDSSFLRRFHKKIFIPLPNKEARLDIIKNSFENVSVDLTDKEWNEIGERTEGYSGSDLMNVIMTSCYERFMCIRKSKYWENKGNFWIPGNSASLFSTRLNFEEIPPKKVGMRSVLFSDLEEAIAKTPKTVDSEELLKFLEFSKMNKTK